MGSAITPSFVAALRAHLEELRAHLGQHPDAEELAAYARGGLSPGRAEEISEHLVLCEGCRSRFPSAAREAVGEAGSSASPAGSAAENGSWPTPEEQDRAWSNLCRRLNGRPYEWRPLSREVAAGPLPWAEVRSVARRAAESLARLHAKGGVIRDLRPETVALDPERKTIRFLDLGIAAAPESLEIASVGPVHDLIHASLRCASPEQILGEHLDPRSNLFSLGALFYELATGRAPFRGSTPLETAGRVVALEVPPASSYRPEVPPAFDELLARLLAKDPASRPASAGAVAASLAAFEAGDPDPLRALDAAENADAEIERLYRRIDTLLARRRQGSGETIDAEIEAEIQACLQRLRSLQKAEADRFRAAFDERLAMPAEAGREILDRAAALRKKLEALAAPHPPAS